MIFLYIIKIGRFPKKKRIKINSNKTRHSRNKIKKDNNFIAKSISAKNVSPLLGMTLVLFITVIALILSNALLDLLTTGSGIYIYKMMIEDTMPIAYASSEKGQIKLSGLANILLGFNLNDPKSILSSQVYAFNIPSKETVESTHKSKETRIVKTRRMRIPSLAEF